MKIGFYKYLLIAIALVFTGCGEPELSSSTGNVPENSPAGTAAGSVSISNVGDSVLKSIVLSGAGNENFSVDTQGKITVKAGAVLDYEVTNVYNLSAIATNTQGSSVSVDVKINILNVADVRPSLSSFNSTIQENVAIGTVVGSINISDSGDSSIKSFTLSNTNYFEISASGEIKTKFEIDFENTQVHNLTVFADNDAGSSNTVSVTINIGDIDEVVIYVPTLTPSVSSINENAGANAVVGNINITSNGGSPISSIALTGSGYDNFAVSTDGIIRLNVGASLNYEDITVYNLFAVARNSVGDSASVSVKINVVNTNDVVPVLSVFEIDRNENLAIGTILGDINVVNSGDSAITSFTLSDTTNFNINSDGDITTKTQLDFETKKLYTLSVYATNAAGNSDSVDVIINILNVNDVVPVLEGFTASLDEGVSIGTIVGTVSITDFGDSAISSFRLSDSSSFDISTLGEITTRRELVYATRNVYNLEVYAVNEAGRSAYVSVTVNINDLSDKEIVKIPTLVVIMNWTDFSESDPTPWSDKMFNKSMNSVNRWYGETTNGALEFTPVNETSGITNDGVIIVNMNKNHPGGADDDAFKDIEVKNAILNSEVANSMDFAALDQNDDGILNALELQIIFIVAGGEESAGDPKSTSVWAHAWSFYGEDETIKVDGMTVMRYTSAESTRGKYARFGSTQRGHEATIGVMVHEIGHSALFLKDYYDKTGGSGLGWYDVMSAGSWAMQSSDTYKGETPTQFSAFNRINVGLNLDLTDVNSAQDIKIKCSSNELISIETPNPREFFLIECRDTSKLNSEISLEKFDTEFTDNKLFTMMYHLDLDKDDNQASGEQTLENHYKLALVEKDETELMTNDWEGLRYKYYADYDDVYILGDVIEPSRTKLYDGTITGYKIEIIAEDYTQRTMTIRIVKEDNEG